MARFTDEKKWSDKWFRSLTASQKLVWIYVCDNCDIAGFYEVDIEYIAFHTGLDIEDVRGSIEGLSRGYLGAKDSEFIWIKNFLKHQKNHILNENNNCHKGIIKRIEEKLDQFPTIPDILGAKEPLFRGTGKGKGKGNSKGNNIEINIDVPSFIDLDLWNDFIKMRKSQKAVNSERALNTLINFLKENQSDANAIIEQSIVNSWKGLFALKKPKGQEIDNNKEFKPFKPTGLFS